MAPESCLNCGADLPRNAKACPECGADEATGWGEDIYGEHLGLPAEDFDYDKFVDSEFGGKQSGHIKPRNLSWMWWIVGVILILVVLSWFIR